ncbi:MAG: hypothetical protein Q7U10_05800 [Thermodesulfovibrionia bacterium]|nr:hypothetical protein [Thermodesulfovibrionia bacterium]
MKLLKLLIVFLFVIQLSGCFFTKVVTVPMRVGGAVVSVIPGVGNAADGVIDLAADGIDTVPF